MMESILPRLPVEMWGFHFNYGTVVNSAVVVLVVAAIFAILLRRLDKFPRRAQVAVEMLVGAFDGIVCQTMGKKLGRRFLPLIGTLFIFILVCNVIGIFPLHSLTWGHFPEAGLEIGGEPVIVDLNDNGIWEPGEPFADENGNGIRDNGILIPALEEPTKDINLTLGVAIWLAAIMYLSAILMRGPLHIIKNLFQPLWFMFPLNLIGKVAEVGSVSFRLFGNIFGGAVIFIVVNGLIFSWLPTAILVPFLPIVISMFIGLGIGLVQAFVYTMLWLTYTTNEVGVEEEEAA